MNEPNPSLYEMLLQNFDGELALHQVSEEDQHGLSVLDNLQRILNSRSSSLSHLPDYGLSDMGLFLQGMPSAVQALMDNLVTTLLKYEPRLAKVRIEALTQRCPGYLDYALEVHLKSGRQMIFATTLTPGGKVLLRHLKRQEPLP